MCSYDVIRIFRHSIAKNTTALKKNDFFFVYEINEDENYDSKPLACDSDNFKIKNELKILLKTMQNL